MRDHLNSRVPDAKGWHDRGWRMKAIPTTFQGYELRSRLEARWATFLDKNALSWRYETEGFILSPMGERYLPDFYIPELGIWLEIKRLRQ